MFCLNPQCPDAVFLGIHGEYREELTVCPKCGATLAAKDPDREDDEVEEDAGPRLPPLAGPVVVAAEYLLQQDADLATSFLVGHGIRAMALSDDCGGIQYGGVGRFRRVVVEASDLEAARALLEEAELRHTERV